MKTSGGTPRVYLIGAGVIARTHAAAAGRLPGGGAAVAVADPSEAARESFREQFHSARVFADSKEMLAEPATQDDVVVVAAPVFAHAAMALAALESGRHVLCEKPLAMDGGEARAMLAAARRAGRLLGCCSDRFLGTDATEEVKRLVESGALGRLYHATFVHRRQRARTGLEYQGKTPWFLDRSRSGGGTVMDWGPYDFSTLSEVLSPVRVDVVSAWMASPETGAPLPEGAVFDVEQHAGASLVYHRNDGSRVAVTYERAACTHGAERDVAEIEGDRGAVRWDWRMRAGPEAEVVRTVDVDGKAVSETVLRGPGHVEKMLDRPLHYFYERIRTGGGPALVDAQAVFNFLCLRAVYDCATTGRAQSVSLNDMMGGLA